MKNRRKLAIIGTVTAILLFGGLAQAAEFSADIVTKAGGQQMQGKVYIKGDKVREEFNAPGGAMISIARGDKKVMYMVMPAQRAYQEMPFGNKPGGPAGQTPGAPPKDEKMSQKKLGTETVNGVVADKFETTVQTERGPVKGHLWVSQKLGVPVRMASEDNSYVKDYKNIKEGGVSDSVFEIPAGYRKMPMPGGPGGPGGPMPRGRQ